MTRGTLKFAQTQTGDRWEIMRRAEELRAEETRRLTSALWRRIRAVSVLTKTMPLGNQTKMTEAERVLLGRWIADGAEIE